MNDEEYNDCILQVIGKKNPTNLKEIIECMYY